MFKLLRLLMVAAFISFVVAILSIPQLRGYAHWLLIQPNDGRSACFGSVKAGRLAYGQYLPFWGENYRAYHWSGWLLGRSHAHDRIKKVMKRSYEMLANKEPELRFTYGEISWPWGGRLWPHVTHRNGEAVDFFVPVRRIADDASVYFPASVFNKLGYNFEFDGWGISRDYRIDYDAMVQHLLVLDAAARKEGTPIRRVIFDPKLQPLLFAAKDGDLLKARMRFSKRRSWVRHDEHYHVNFDLPCKSK